MHCCFDDTWRRVLQKGQSFEIDSHLSHDPLALTAPIHRPHERVFVALQVP